MANRIQLRRGTASQWTTTNPVLAQGEPGIETDTGKQKFGNGVTAWSGLPYASQGPAGPAGPADDATVAPLVSNPATATRAALDAAYTPTTAVAENMPRHSAYLAHEDKLSGWRQALAGQANAAAQIVVFGDSISEGTGNTTAANRWINRAQAKLRYRYGVSGGAEFPFIPAIPKTTTAGFPVTRSGSISVDSTYGLGWRTAVLTDATSTVTFTFTGTSAKLMYFKASGTGVMSIVVDGGTPTVVDTNSTRNPPAGNGTNTWSTGALTAGTHTVQIKWDATSTQNVYVMGLLTYNGDEASGIRILDASYHGISSPFLTSTRNTTASNALLAVGTVSLVVIAIETNDYGNATALATYKANIQAFIDALRTGNAQYKGNIALVNMYKSDGRDEATWNGYAQQLKDIAAADPRASFFDLRLRMPDIPLPYNLPQALGLFSDSLHPNDRGSEWLGTVMADYLSLRTTPVLTTTKTTSYSISATDMTTYWVFDGSSITATLPDPTVVAGNARLVVKNINASALTVSSAGTSKTIDGSASQSLTQWAKATYISDGSNWITV